MTLFILMPGLAQAVTTAVVGADRAIIYADMKRKHPIGYLPKWKRIKVGDIARNAGKVVPVVISGKIAYISTDDISVARDMSLLNDRFTRFGKKDKLTSPKKHDISIALTNYMGTAATDASLGTTEIGLNFFGIAGKWNYKWDYKRDIRFGVETSTVVSNDGVTIISYTLSAEATYRIFKWAGYEARVLGSLKASPVTQIQTSTFSTNGYALGGGIGGEIKKDLWGRWVARSELGIFANQLYVDLPEPFEFFTPLSIGPKFGISIGYYY